MAQEVVHSLADNGILLQLQTTGAKCPWGPWRCPGAVMTQELFQNNGGRGNERRLLIISATISLSRKCSESKGIHGRGTSQKSFVVSKIKLDIHRIHVRVLQIISNQI